MTQKQLFQSLIYRTAMHYNYEIPLSFIIFIVIDYCY